MRPFMLDDGSAPMDPEFSLVPTFPTTGQGIECADPSPEAPITTEVSRGEPIGWERALALGPWTPMLEWNASR